MGKQNMGLRHDNYIIRQVRKDDSKAVWQIRNHPLVRKNAALNKKIIPFDEHKIWFEKNYFKNKNNLCYILEKEGRVLGYCRFDRKNSERRISIAIDPKFHGQGLGHYLLNNSLKKLKNKKNLIANVRIDNKASFSLFRKNNFELIGIIEINKSKYYHFEYKVL